MISLKALLIMHSLIFYLIYLYVIKWNFYTSLNTIGPSYLMIVFYICYNFLTLLILLCSPVMCFIVSESLWKLFVKVWCIIWNEKHALWIMKEGEHWTCMDFERTESDSTRSKHLCSFSEGLNLYSNLCCMFIIWTCAFVFVMCSFMIWGWMYNNSIHEWNEYVHVIHTAIKVILNRRSCDCTKFTRTNFIY